MRKIGAGYYALSDKSVSVRTSRIAPDGRYPLPFFSLKARVSSDFPLRFEINRNIAITQRKDENNIQ